MSFMYVDTEDFFFEADGTGFCGTAKIETDTARYFDADIGGSDGLETYFNLICVRIGGHDFSRTAVEEMFSPAMVEAFLEKVARGEVTELAA